MRVLTFSGLAVAMLLAGCAGTVVAATDATVSEAQGDLQLAIDVYGIADGIAKVAEVARPELVAIVTPIEALVDPKIVTAQAALNTATVDAAAIEALAASINAQALVLEAKTASVVAVVPAPK